MAETRCYVAIESSVDLWNRMLLLRNLSQEEKKKKEMVGFMKNFLAPLFF